MDLALREREQDCLLIPSESVCLQCMVLGCGNLRVGVVQDGRLQSKISTIFVSAQRLFE